MMGCRPDIIYSYYGELLGDVIGRSPDFLLTGPRKVTTV